MYKDSFKYWSMDSFKVYNEHKAKKSFILYMFILYISEEICNSVKLSIYMSTYTWSWI